jgi:Domain of unknown function (DUF4139)/N-terminal domain of unknown function (DUF4140)
MKKVIFIFFLSPLMAFSQVKTQSVSSVIQQVTVFFNGAQVQRTANASINSGRTELIFKALTPNLDPRSLQVKSEGNFVVMSVNHQTNYLTETDKKDTLKVLEKMRDEMTDKINTENDKLTVLNHQETLLQRNEVQLLGIPNNSMKLEDLKQTIDFQELKYAFILEKRQNINKSIAKIHIEINKINLQINELSSKKTDPTSEIHVIVNATNTASGKFQISYLVPNANWYPTYDLRVKDILSPLSILMKANVSQSSGEDWKDVKLTLSTGNPTESGSKPDLQPWRLGMRTIYKNNRNIDLSYFNRNPNIRHISGIVTDGQNGEPVIGASVVIKGTNKGAVTDANGHYELDLPITGNIITISFIGYEMYDLPITQPLMNVSLKESSLALQEVVVTGYSAANDLRGRVAGIELKKEKVPTNSTTEIITEKQQATTTTYDIDLPYSINTDGKYNSVEIKDINIAATYQYYVTPKLDRDAFLTAQIVDWEQYNLQSGEANLFFEGTFLGKTYLNAQATNDTMNISLGRDKNVVVTRTKLKEFTKKGFLSGKRSDSRSFDIVVKNKKSQAINIIIEDQIPLSVNKEVEIENEHKNAELNAETGELTWKLKVESGKEQKVNLNYTIKYPKEMVLPLE